MLRNVFAAVGRIARLGVVALASIVMIGDLAFAQDIRIEANPVCYDLQAQYVALLRQGGGGSNSGRGMLDAEAVSRELANAQIAARQGNCNRFLFFGPRPSPQCPAINNAIGRLRQQLAQMRSRNGGGFFRSPDTERARLRDWMQQYGCEVPQSYGGTRTICVRKCDGYFFPISFATNRSQFPRDEQVCQSMYAEAGRAELYAYDGHDLDTAVSMTGQRYKDQYYAFLFRDHFSATCQGQLKDGIAALGVRYWEANPRRASVVFAPAVDALAPLSVAVTVPMPNLRPLDLQEDPETIANRVGGFAVAPYVPAADHPASPELVAGPSVRHVGEAYYVTLFDPALPPVPEVHHRAPLGFDLIGAARAAESDETSSVPAAPTASADTDAMIAEPPS